MSTVEADSSSSWGALVPVNTPGCLRCGGANSDNTVRVQSKGVHTPNIGAVPSAQHAALYSKRLPDSGGQTVAEFFIKQHPGFAFEEVPELTDAGAGGTDVAIFYERSAENLNLDLVMPFNQLPAQARNLELVVPCLARTAGVTVHYPLALTKGEGI